MTIDPLWLDALRQRLDMPPSRPRTPWGVAVAGADPAIVGSLETDLALDLAGAGLALRDAGDAWRLEVPGASDVDAALAQMAQWLHRTGRAGAWRDELLDVTDVEGRCHGVIERAAVRPLGVATRAVHLVLSDAAGSVWVQQRSLHKDIDPGLWDTAVGGLVAAGQSLESACQREAWEEAGVRPSQLGPIRPFGRFTVRRPVSNGYMVEHVEMFEAVAATGVTPENQDGEVAGFACLTRVELRRQLLADAFTLESAMILARWLDRQDA